MGLFINKRHVKMKGLNVKIQAEETDEMFCSLEWGKQLVLGRHWFSVHDRLPRTNKEVIVLDRSGRISFGHIVNKDFAVSFGGWNIPDIAFWMPFVPSEEMKHYYKWEE